VHSGRFCSAIFAFVVNFSLSGRHYDCERSFGLFTYFLLAQVTRILHGSQATGGHGPSWPLPESATDIGFILRTVIRATHCCLTVPLYYKLLLLHFGQINDDADDNELYNMNVLYDLERVEFGSSVLPQIT